MRTNLPRKKPTPKTAALIPLHPPELEPHEPKTGFSVAWNPRKKCYVYRVHYTADPDKRDPRWIAGVRAGMSRAAHRREYEMDFTAPGESPYYPEFAEKWEQHVARCPGLIKGPVYRIWDFGRQHPACLWLQHSPVSQRIWVIRECLGTNINIWNFRDLVLYLSGQLSIQYLMKQRPQARKHLADLHLQRQTERFHDVPKIPWFSGHEQFVDIGGFEAKQGSDREGGEDGSEKGDDRTRAAILAQSGVMLREPPHQDIAASTEIISQLVLDWPDRHGNLQPGLMVDPACPLLIEGMKGGIGYPKPTAKTPVPTKPFKDGFYEHLHDCLRYAVVYLIPVGPKGEILRPDHSLGAGVRKRKQKEEVMFGENYVDRWGR
jgi:hypothetical protein